MFEIGQAVYVNTAYLDTEPERWERATVRESRWPGISDRFIEVEYSQVDTDTVRIERVRPDASDHRTPFQATADTFRDAVALNAKVNGWNLGQAHSYCFGSITSAVDSGDDPETIRAISLGLQQGTARL